ncbi:MAG: hypothetical protein M2R45_05403 [Verrucomicrobia subdivision 3 bacterium]|nr:hypothetical protein [Limisphaerales bacterium]
MLLFIAEAVLEIQPSKGDHLCLLDAEGARVSRINQLYYADMVGLILMHKLKLQQATTFSREMATVGEMKANGKRYPACNS